MPDSTEPKADTGALQRRRWLLLGTATVVVAVAAVGLALFQPWKLWVDDTVDEAAPAGAVPITSPTPTTALPAPTTAAAPTDPPSVTAPVSAALATTTTTAPVTTVAPPTTAAPTVPATPVGGAFIGIDHGTTGTAVLLQDATGAQFLRLQDLDTSNGPDLFVYPSTNPPDGTEGEFDDDYLSLGRLEGNVGSSNYPIPAGTDLARYASVVIWCDRFNSAFGAAPLR
jgi:Electron transfer DM13